MNYFAYGSNMSPARLLARTPSALWLGSYALPGHQLRFHKVGADGSAKCDAFQTDRPEHQVLGVLYLLSEAEKPDLDLVEGLGRGYNQKSVAVIDAQGRECQAFTYYATAIDDRLQPFDWYLEHVLTGARAANLPAAYIRGISAIDVIRDLDAQRRALELGLYTAIPGDHASS